MAGGARGVRPIVGGGPPVSSIVLVLGLVLVLDLRLSRRPEKKGIEDDTKDPRTSEGGCHVQG